MSDKTPDELPKQVIAAKVVTPKRRYFMPEFETTVEAATAEEAGDKAARRKSRKVTKKAEEGDGNR